MNRTILLRDLRRIEQAFNDYLDSPSDQTAALIETFCGLLIRDLATSPVRKPINRERTTEAERLRRMR